MNGLITLPNYVKISFMVKLKKAFYYFARISSRSSYLTVLIDLDFLFT